jgi:hypothetical protein
MAEIVVIDGREFAVGDAVLVESQGKWWAGRIVHVVDGPRYPILVDCTDGGRRVFAPREVHSIRENFA